MTAKYLPRSGIVMGATRLIGDGAPVICLPGLGFAAAYLAPLFAEPPLRGRAAVLVDLPGTGMSEPLEHQHDITAHAEATAEFMDSLSLSAAPIFGHSLGGTVGIELARARPDLVSRLIIAEGNLTPGGGGASRAMSAGTLDDFVAGGLDMLMQDRRAAGVDGDEIAAFLYAGRLGLDARALYETARALVDLDPTLEEAFLSMKIPRAFVYGEKSLPASPDDATPDAPCSDHLSRHGVKIEVVSKSGHLMVYENAIGSAEAIARHI